MPCPRHATKAGAGGGDRIKAGGCHPRGRVTAASELGEHGVEGGGCPLRLAKKATQRVEAP
jgi:hypothetical protein